MARDKRITMEDAVRLVPDRHAVLALGGVTLYRRPMAFALALRSAFRASGQPTELTLLAFTAGMESDLLVGAGVVSRVRSCYFGLEAFGLAPHFTSAAGKGEIEIVEETEASLAFGLRASLAGVGFMPSRAWQGTVLPELRPDVRTVVDPYSGEELTAFPAIACDVAVLHALEADMDGNADLGRNLGVDVELALVAKTVIVTAERVIPRLARADVVGPLVTAVVEAPYGAWPTSCHPLYPLDGLQTLRYTEAAGTEAEPALLSEWAAHQRKAGSQLDDRQDGTTDGDER
ncbi:MAG TPA: CoA-transferase [Anaerolineales bacterium]|nr:CoA-transferase [Anaerolineales bacterium]